MQTEALRQTWQKFSQSKTRMRQAVRGTTQAALTLYLWESGVWMVEPTGTRHADLEIPIPNMQEISLRNSTMQERVDLGCALLWQAAEDILSGLTAHGLEWRYPDSGPWAHVRKA